MQWVAVIPQLPPSDGHLRRKAIEGSILGQKL